MSRRRLRLVSSSDEEDEPQRRQPEQHDEEFFEDEDVIDVELRESTVSFQTVSLNSLNPNPNSNSNSTGPVPLDISDGDEDYFDVSNDLSPPFPPPPPPTSSIPVQSVPNSGDAGCSISEVLSGLGLRLRREWLDSCIRALESSVPGFRSYDAATKAKFCFEQFLHSDMNYTGAGVLPDNVHSMHLVDLAGPFVLQVDEMVNISCALKGRYQNASSGLKRCLKLSMTDGVQRVFGIEYRPIKDLEVLAPAGMKVAICNVNIRRGLLLLVPEVLEVLGGLVEEFDSARQRLVVEVNKPPRGKRTRNGVVPPLATRATLAAWPPSGVGVPEQTTTSAPQVAIPSQPDVQGGASSTSINSRTREDPAVPIQRENREPNPSSTSDGNIQIADENIQIAGEDIQIVDEVEHLSILTGDREIPFNYLASLLAKWAAMKDKAFYVRGKIKCFLTGVKGFQYKQRSTFELWVYVDDGSLISEILIDHNVVQKGIGHSPQEVTAALVSSDVKRVSDMKETLKKFQIFLANFEGTMEVRISEAYPVPLAIEMNQGCSLSDIQLLLRRLNSSSSVLPQRSNLDPIDISP